MNTNEFEELYEEIKDIADYIAFNNSDFICSACLEVLERLKELVYNHYGINRWKEFTEMINSTLEGEDE